ncbi:hypothetical protein C2G38_2297121 [Gigaspora rosea]|uniref:P-loop containing nucleoside triphosphate hydrolase protein n=1 Tax=Gigaspora rosea TaxID=44941 RepID=A0A397VJL6_9GLOM|nr:hypothetical protein C2G38_2297121 [Gigaspora rosea]
MDYSPEAKKNYDFFLRRWNLRPNKNYYNYIDGAILVYDISHPNGLEKIKELSREYVNTDSNYVINNIPIMIIANRWDENKQKSRDDLLNEVNNFVGEEFLCDVTSIEEKTSTSLEAIIKKCISRLLDFREINDLNELASASSQFKPMMRHATQLNFYGIIPKKVIDDRRKEILNEEIDEIKSFLLLEVSVNSNIIKTELEFHDMKQYNNQQRLLLEGEHKTIKLAMHYNTIYKYFNYMNF